MARVVDEALMQPVQRLPQPRDRCRKLEVLTSYIKAGEGVRERETDTDSRGQARIGCRSRSTDRQKDRQTRTDRQTDGQTDRQTETVRRIDRLADIHTD